MDIYARSLYIHKVTRAVVCRMQDARVVSLLSHRGAAISSSSASPPGADFPVAVSPLERRFDSLLPHNRGSLAYAAPRFCVSMCV